MMVYIIILYIIDLIVIDLYFISFFPCTIMMNKEVLISCCLIDYITVVHNSSDCISAVAHNIVVSPYSKHWLPHKAST